MAPPRLFSAVLVVLLAQRVPRPGAAQHTPPPALPLDGPFLICTSQQDFISDKISFINGICCKQVGESCNAAGFPTTCASPACARAVQMVSDGCLEWLARPEQTYLAYLEPLKQLTKTCKASAVPVPHPVLLTADSTSLTGAQVCGATIIDGRAESHDKWQDVLVISSPQNTRILITVATMWLPPDDSLEIRDGDSDTSPLLKRLKGTQQPEISTVVGSGQQMFLRLLSNGENKGKAVGFSLTVGCSCAEAVSYECFNGGMCTVLDTTCATAEMHRTITNMNAQCCGADDAVCSGGMPTSCDAGCASVFLPFWKTCGWQLGSEQEYANLVSV